jgi:ABC-type transport system involved in multi-copper enzyme maturation permease subunit
MRKIWTIAWKELYTQFTDRHLILIMLVTPLAISTIVGLVFGGTDEGDVPIQDIPMAVVNHDRGNNYNVNYGTFFLSLLVPGYSEGEATNGGVSACDLSQGERDEGSAGVSLFDLTDAKEFDLNEANAVVKSGLVEQPEVEPGSDLYVDTVVKAAVDRGEYVAAIIVDPDFTQNLTYIPVLQPRLEGTGVTVYANSGSPISAGIIRSIAEGIVNQIATGTITIATAFSEMQQSFGSMAVAQAASTMDMSEAFACAFDPVSNIVGLKQETLQSSSQESTSAAVLVSVGSAQAMFFALFTAQFGVLSMHEERRNWTLQRLVMSPTPRSSILAGKLVGVFASVIFQLLMLFIALSLVGSIMQGHLALIWGSDVLAILLVLLSASLAVSGLGMLLAGIIKSPEQAQVFSSVLNIGLAVLGGAFGFSLPKSISQISLVYWGRNAFDMLAAGQSDIGLNVMVLVVQGLVMFAIGIVLFNRRFEL